MSVSVHKLHTEAARRNTWNAKHSRESVVDVDEKKKKEHFCLIWGSI
jgi:hypothetical protein